MIADFYDTFNKETDDDIPQEVLEVLSEKLPSNTSCGISSSVSLLNVS